MVNNKKDSNINWSEKLNTLKQKEKLSNIKLAAALGISARTFGEFVSGKRLPTRTEQIIINRLMDDGKLDKSTIVITIMGVALDRKQVGERLASFITEQITNGNDVSISSN